MPETSEDRAVSPPSTGEPDALDRLWTPHRMTYIAGQERPSDGCAFCQAPDLPRADSLMVARGTLVYAVLNLYPYNPGHLLICPYRHLADYTEMTVEETAELAGFTQTAMRVIRATSSAHGFNIGMNQGSVAGAGIAAHLHQHVVPRWGGDANFMPIVARTKILPQLLTETRDLLSSAWPS
ncbi:ATP adenylyltransferase [Catenuloplanes nepalensis]|uniref:ATP adenylyltransferase n=2 Tax=Catenuloplanes nepalensis TaxID=587533 RepID=A0ABT9MXY7_9ACTN|nr:ATP adenylyltransferase [Catenuloplanes nepalensis]